MDFDKVLKWNRRFHTVAGIAQKTDVLSTGGALASDIVVGAGQIPDATEFTHYMIEMFKLDKDGKGPMACVVCDTLYVGSFRCPECGGAGEPVKEWEFDDSDPFAGDPFAE